MFDPALLLLIGISGRKTELINELNERIEKRLIKDDIHADKKSKNTFSYDRSDDLRCPACGSERLIKNGFRGELQKMKCKNCGRTFVPDHVLDINDQRKFQVFVRRFDEPVRTLSKSLEISSTTVQSWKTKVVDHFIHRECFHIHDLSISNSEIPEDIEERAYIYLVYSSVLQ